MPRFFSDALRQEQSAGSDAPTRTQLSINASSMFSPRGARTQLEWPSYPSM
jgi:hypothetical protein